MTNNYVRRLSVLWTTAAQRDGLTVAVGVHVVVVHTRTTPVNDETTPSRLPKMAWRRIIVRMCRECMNDDYVHAKRNGKAVPLNSSRPKNGNASHIVVSQR